MYLVFSYLFYKGVYLFVLAVVAIGKLLNRKFEIMASSEGILGMTVNPLRFHLRVFLGVMQKL